MLAYFTCPLDANERCEYIEFDTTVEYIATIHIGSTNSGDAHLQAVCSSQCHVDVACSTMLLEPWTAQEALRNNWPEFNIEDVWTPCTEIPSFDLSPGVVFTYTPKDKLAPYRRLRFRVTPTRGSETIHYAAFRLDLSIR